MRLGWIAVPAVAVALAGCGGQSMFTSREPIAYAACDLADFQHSVWLGMAHKARRDGDPKARDQATWVQARIVAGSPACFAADTVREAQDRLTGVPPGD